MGDLASVHELLHVLWSKAVGTDEYKKAEWKLLEAALAREVDRLREALARIEAIGCTEGAGMVAAQLAAIARNALASAPPATPRPEPDIDGLPEEPSP